MKSLSLIDFIKTTKKSKSTILRFYKKNPDIRKEVKYIKRKNYYPLEHTRYFDSEIMYDENKQLLLENKSMKNVINCLMDRNSLQMRLWYMDWTYLYTVAYKSERNKKSCFRMMNGLYDSLIERYGSRTEIRMFFTTEPFANRNGYHNHFVIYISNDSIKEILMDEINQYFEYDRVDSRPYNPYKAGLFYIAKDGLVNEDWDILGNNLKDEATNEKWKD